MIKLKTNCDECVHKKVCKNINNAELNMNKLKKIQYGTGSNNDYYWDIMMKHYNVVIEFSCPDFEKIKSQVKTSQLPGGRFV